MADYTFAGMPLVAGDITVPLCGACHGEVYFADPDARVAVGQVGSLSVLGVTRVCAVTLAGTEALASRCRLVGGAGRLDQQLDPRDYRGYSAGMVAADCLGEAGESVGAGWDLWDARLDHWLRAAGTCRQALRRLARLHDDPSLHWRVLPDGTASLVSETWPDNTRAVQIGREPAPQEGLVVVYPRDGSLGPGQSVTAFGVARRVGRVQYTWSGDGDASCALWYE